MVSEPETLSVDLNGFSSRVWRKGEGPKLGFFAGFGGLPRWIPFLDALAREMDAIVEKGYVIIGSPDEVAAQLKEVAANLNVGHLMLLMQFGNMGKDLAKYNTQLFAEKVMPQLTELFAEWEDRWWPQPMNRESRAPLTPFRQPAMAAE